LQAEPEIAASGKGLDRSDWTEPTWEVVAVNQFARTLSGDAKMNLR
jgi:hypothetical protein